MLNASYEPLNVCSTRRAHVLVWKGKAEVVERLDEPLRTATNTYMRPHVIRLVNYVRVPQSVKRRISRRALFARDGWRCVYCGDGAGASRSTTSCRARVAATRSGRTSSRRAPRATCARATASSRRRTCTSAAAASALTGALHQPCAPRASRTGASTSRGYDRRRRPRPPRPRRADVPHGTPARARVTGAWPPGRRRPPARQRARRRPRAAPSANAAHSGLLVMRRPSPSLPRDRRDTSRRRGAGPSRPASRERRGDVLVERMAAEHAVEPVVERPRGDRARDELHHVDAPARERADRLVERPGRWCVSNVSAVRHSPSRRSSRVYGASAAKRV